MITLLHVDDDERELRLASRFLNQISNYLRIIQATSGEEALDIIRKMRLDCVVADYHMPTMNGLELFEQMRQNGQHIPYILLTGKGNEKVASEAISRGVDAYLIKAGDIYFYEELLGTVKRLREEREQQQEREKALSVLRESDKYLAEVQRAARIGYAVFNISTGYWTSSEIADEILGIDASYTKTLEGWMSLIEEEYRNSFLYHFQSEAMGEKGRFDMQFPITTNDTGERRWLHVLGKVSFDPNKNPVSMIGTVRDITSAKATSAQLEQTQRRFETYLELDPNGVFISDHAGKYLEVNKVACSLTGYSRDELLNMHIAEILDKEKRQEGLTHFERLLQEGRTEGEVTVRTRENEKRFWIVRAGRISETRYIGIVQDSTEERLQRCRLPLLISHSADFALEIDMETGRISGFGKTSEYLPGNGTVPKTFRWQDFLQLIEEQRRGELAEFVENSGADPLPGMTAHLETGNGGRINTAFTRFVYVDDEELSHYRLLLCETLSD